MRGRADDFVGILAFVLISSLWLAAIGGWIANVVKFAGVLNDPVTGMMVFRAIGIVCLPLGAILGWL